MKDKLLKLFEEFLETAIGDIKSTSSSVESNTEIIKSLDEDQRRALFVVLEPQNEDGTTSDLHGDWYSEQDIEEACHNFNVACMKAGLMHRVVLDDNAASILQSFTALHSFDLEDGTHIKKGTWLQWWHIPDDELWQAIKNGDIDSVSIECVADAYEIR